MKFEYKGYDVEIVEDYDPQDPRNDDNLGRMVCFHGRYDLGDQTLLRSSQFDGWDGLEAHLEKRAAVILPLYMYDHGGITISTTPFSCPWDSGQIGFIYADREKVCKEYGWKRVSPQRRERLAELLRGEVKIYDEYLSGDVWGFSITKDGQDVETCYGFYGHDYCKEEAKSIIDYINNKIIHKTEKS